MITHLRYSINWGLHNNIKQEHPQLEMKKLGIIYQYVTPQSILDEWWFWNCENVPNPLPEYLEVLNINPFDAIGYGLSKEDAKHIFNYKKSC